VRAAALAFAVLAVVVYLVALLGGAVGGVELVVLGHVFVAACLACMNLPTRVVR
jgi:hypothetical protein